MISSGFTELRNAYLSHSCFASTGNCDAHHLLLFYGLECGLKSIYLRRNRMQRTDQIGDQRLRSSHDIYFFIKELRLPAQVAGTSAPFFRLERDGTALPVKIAHEVWRYGIMIQNDDLEILVAWMQAVQKWIREAI